MPTIENPGLYEPKGSTSGYNTVKDEDISLSMTEIVGLTSTNGDTANNAETDHSVTVQKSASLLYDASTKDAQEIEQFKTPRRIILLRVAVFGAIYTAAAVLGALTYQSLLASQMNTFNAQFDSTANLLMSSIQRGITTKLATGATVAEIFAYSFNSSNPTWPNVTLPGFEVIGDQLIGLSQSRAVSFNPVIPNAATGRPKFDAYALEEQYLQVGYNPAKVLWPISKGIYAKNSAGTPIVATGNPASASYPNVLVPVWQIAPIASNMKAVMYDLHSEVHRMKALDQLFLTGQPALTDIVQLVQDSVQRPSTILFAPVNSIGSGQLVGTTSVVFSWDQVISDILPDYVSGIVIVLSTSTSAYTYTVESGRAILTGPGDLHDTAFNDYETSFTASLNSLSGTVYHCSIYPSVAYQNSFLNSQPENSAIQVVVVIFATSVVFLIYDYLVSSREALLTATARTAYSVVNSLYPSFVRARILTQHQHGSSESIASAGGHDPASLLNKELLRSPSAKLRSYISSSFGNEVGQQQTGAGLCVPRKGDASDDADSEFKLSPSSSQMQNAPPIAESFDQVTVLFGDIAGFTHWSSGHPPTQVFDLLETLYAEFDAAARMLGVFKVETIGDCYLAVTGIPDQNPDHAVTMAKFAIEMQRALVKVKANKSAIDGVKDLELRIGMHTGPCTAGVLRGYKPRFQLFGDTVNTASRMESLSIAGRIQVSEQAAAALQGVESFKFTGLILSQRPDKISAKGKGELTTYWLTKTATFY